MDVVDVMTVISDPHEFEYLRNGDVWLSLLLMLKYSPPQHVRVHIMTNNVKVLSIGKELGLHMYWMQDYQRHHDQFMALYRPNHHSINTVEYEFLCYYRWHLYKYILDSWNQRLGINNTNTTYSTTSSTTNSSINSDTNRHLLGVDSYDQEGFESVEDDRPIKKIITMDSDIVFLMDPLVFYNKVIASLDQPGLRMDSKPSDSYNSTDSSITSDNSCSNGNNTEYDLVVVTSGALHLWTAKGIQDYSQYIFDWYSQDPEVVTAKTKTVSAFQHS